MTCFAPSSADILGLQVCLPGFGFNNPEQPLPTSSYTVTAAVEYPAGVFTPLTINGGRTLTVLASENLYAFDFLPIRIPAGTAFYIKLFVQWTPGNFWLVALTSAQIQTDWTVRGTNLSDNTLTATTFSPTNPSAGFGAIVYAQFASAIQSIGVLGDSIGFGTADSSDPTTDARFFERAVRNVLPIINLSRNGDAAAVYLQQHQGKSAILANTIDRLICEYGRNDMNGAPALTTVQTRFQTLWAPYLAAGVKVWQVTVTPESTSTDNFATRAGQSVANPSEEALRLQFNNWIRTSWVSLGLSGFIDMAWAVDPTDSGVWNADGTPGTTSAGFCTLSNGSVSSVARAAYNSANSGGTGYPTNSTIACSVYGHAGETGTLPVITANVDGTGKVSTFNLVSSGNNLLYQPMVAPNGAWTADGTHPNARGYNAIISYTGLGPAMFA